MKLSKNIKINKNSLIYCLLFGLMLIQIFRPLRVLVLVSVGTWIIVLATLMNFVLDIIFKKKVNKYFLLTWLLLMVVILSMLVSNELSYLSIVAMLSFIEIPLFFSSKNRIDSETKNAIYGIFVILGVFYILQGFSPNAYLYETEYGKYIESLTLGYYNPNETALHLLVCNIILISLWFKTKKYVSKILLSGEIIIISYYILLTQSRIAIITLLFLFLMLIVYCRKTSGNIPNKITYIVMLIPLLFIFVTMRFSDIMESKIFMGDYLETGRFDIFRRVFDNMTVIKFIFGDYSFRFENLHNGVLSVFGTIGIIGVIVFCVLISKKIFEAFNRTPYELEKKVSLIGILCIILLCSTEAALILSGGAFYVEAISVFMLAED